MNRHKAYWSLMGPSTAEECRGRESTATAENTFFYALKTMIQGKDAEENFETACSALRRIKKELGI